MKKLLFLVIVLVLAWLAACFFAPERPQVQLEETVKFPREVVQNQFKNLSKFAKFAPMISDSTKYLVSLFPMQEGVNARLSYQTKNEDEGVRHLIIKFDEADSIGYEMSDREKDFKVNQIVKFESVGDSKTKIIWKVVGEERSFPLRFLNLFGFDNWKKSIKKSIKGLQDYLKESEKDLLLEIELSKSQKPLETEFLGGKFITLFNETSCDPKEYKTAIKESFGRLHSFLKDFKKYDPTGGYTIFWEYFDTNNDQAKFYCAIQVDESVSISEDDDFEFKFFNNKPSFALQVVEPFDSLHNAYKRMIPFVEKKIDYVPTRGIEVYTQIPDKSETDSVKIYLPIER